MATAAMRQKPVEKRLRPSPGRPISFSVEQYHAIQDAGAISELRRYELLQGQIVEKEVPKPALVRVTRKLRERLEVLLANSGYCARVQDPITLVDSEPEPDLAIVLAPPGRYDERHPMPDDIALLIEVSESSLPSDRSTKLDTYAKAGIPSYWIVNLVGNVVEMYTQPRVGKFRKQAVFSTKQDVPVTIARKTFGNIPVKEFLP